MTNIKLKTSHNLHLTMRFSECFNMDPYWISENMDERKKILEFSLV